MDLDEDLMGSHIGMGWTWVGNRRGMGLGPPTHAWVLRVGFWVGGSDPFAEFGDV
jgi:hypothetical protein